MSNKTISINPSLFSINGPKTKKNKEKKTKPTNVPIISPNVLKNKLLKRIKEHKIRENTSLKTNNAEETSNKINTEPNSEVKNFNDEFMDSINYLQTLSKQKILEENKVKNEIIRQKRKEELERKTLKNYNQNPTTNISEIKPYQTNINLELPEELKLPVQPLNYGPIKINTNSNDVPYGILKGGIKPSYKEWARTQKNYVVNNPNSSLIISGDRINTEKTAREKRLNLLKEKIKQKQQEQKNDILITENLIRKPNLFEVVNPISSNSASSNSTSVNSASNNSASSNSTSVNSASNNSTSVNSASNNSASNNSASVNPTEGEIIATKQITKKTIKRKYTLGKSQIKRTIGILIKDRGTRKLILTAQKDLKRKNINDIKNYLRDHNLIKIGSNAPNDVLRKLYESSMLSGEITNNNSDNLIHNYSKQDKEL
jgi:hypothetical protein